MDRTARQKARPGYAAVIAIVAVAGLGSWQCSATEVSELPPAFAPGAAAGFNVLVITLDTTRADRLGCYGHDGAETPVLDGLAAGGVRFADAVTVAPTTLPSHASIFTGLYPPNHGARRNGEYRLDPGAVTLAEVLRDDGYDTAAFVGAFVLDRRFGLDQGFDHYDDAVNPKASLAVSDSYAERPAAEVTDAALDWLRSRSADRPFFGWVHYFDPHLPFRAPEPYRTRLPGDGYDAEIAYVDAQIGRLLDAVADLGVEESTVVVVTADHGEGLGDHGESSHDFFLYGSVMRVPLIVSAPGLIEGPFVVEDALASVIDVLPTVLGWLDVPAPESDGVDLAAGLPGPDRRAYMESLATYVDYGWSPLYALRRHRDKLIEAPRPEYYHLHEDPEERSPLEPDSALRESLAAMLADWPSVEEVVAGANAVDPETRARLQALGYVGSLGDGPRDATLDPKDMIAVASRYGRARALARAGNVEGALRELEAVVETSPGYRTALAEMAQLYATTGRLPEAERVLRQHIALGETPPALTLLAQVLVATRRFAEADPLARRALALDPGHGMAYIVLGDLAVVRQRYDEGRALYERAREVDPYRMGPAFEQRTAALDRRLARAAAAVTREP